MALITCLCLVDRCLYFCFWPLCCLRYTDSDYPFGIFKLFLMTRFVIYTSWIDTLYQSIIIKT